MRIESRWLCSFLLILGALACGDYAEEPCSAAEAAAGRCQATRKPTAPLPAILPSWAEDLCQKWLRRDGSCDQAEIMTDYQECLVEKGAPEEARLRASGRHSRSTIRGGERATYLCLERRSWVMTPEASDEWFDRPKPPAPPS